MMRSRFIFANIAARAAVSAAREPSDVNAAEIAACAAVNGAEIAESARNAANIGRAIE